MMEDDVLARLVRFACTGPEIPPDGAARIKHAVRPLWIRETRARVRRRILWESMALAMTAAAAWLAIRWNGQDAAPPMVARPIARVEAVEGTVHVPAALLAGSRLATDSRSRVAIRLDGGPSLRLDVNTTVRILSANDVRLGHGAIYVDSGHRGSDPGGSDLVIRTAFGTIRDIGTQFEVRDEAEFIVRVREGVVTLATTQEPIEIRRGTSLTIAAGGSRRREAIATDAPEWHWTQNVTPPFAIDGRSVWEVLAWMSRETGIAVRYESAETEQAAKATILHGELRGLRPDQVTTTVLPTTALASRRARDALVILRR